MALNDDEQRLLNKLALQLGRRAAEHSRLDAYYEGRQRLSQLGIAVPPELALFTTVVAWPEVVVAAVEERLDVEGFRYAGVDEADDELWRVWQANDLDEESQLAHTDALVYGAAYVCVGTNEDDEDTPLVTVESSRDLVTISDPRTRRVTAALRLYQRDDTLATVGAQTATSGTLYLPDKTITLGRRDARWVDDDVDEHDLGHVTVVPLANRTRVRDRSGRSEMLGAISLTDAAARSLTNLQVAAETHAVPQRVVLGATKGDFVDGEGKPLTVWESYFGSIWALGNEDAKAQQFAASDLRNFHETVNHYAQLLSGVYGLPPHYLGHHADNPASADAIRSSEARLIKRCERKQRTFGGTWERVMRLVRQLQTGVEDEGAAMLEVEWRDPATPTLAQKADAVVKLHQAGLMPREAAWEDLGYSSTRRKRLREMADGEDTIRGLTDLLDRQRSPQLPETAPV